MSDEHGVAAARATEQPPNEAMHQCHELLATLSAQIPGIIFQLCLEPDGRTHFPFISQYAANLHGLNHEQVQKDSSLLLAVLHPDDRERVKTTLLESGHSMQDWQQEFRAILPDRTVRWRHGTARPEKRSNGSLVWHGYIHDITGKKELKELVWRQSNYDALTGLPNRRLLRSLLEQSIKTTRRDNKLLALLFLDLDHFKDVNDTLGHDWGDALLQQVAERLGSCTRNSDIIARFGGDEFVIALNDLAESICVRRVVDAILEQFAEAFHLDEHRIHVSASIGITFYPDDAVNLNDLLKNADHAMYAAKKRGRNRYHYFTPSMQEKAHNRMMLVNDLRAALTDFPFQLYYQPIVTLATGETLKAEALIRWQHPMRGLINPNDFIHVAEETGMIGAIGNWVFHTAARQAAHWRQALNPAFQIGINLSPAQFRADDDMLQSWIEHLPQYGLTGEGIALEITENLLLEASKKVTNRLLALRDAGIQVALDDFGTGFSSLSYLKKYDIDYIKIDRSFVQNLAPESDDMALCEAMIVMAHKLGLKVVAEGVETEIQRDLLIAAGCDFAQGYLFSRPIPATEFEEWMRQTGIQPALE